MTRRDQRMHRLSIVAVVGREVVEVWMYLKKGCKSVKMVKNALRLMRVPMSRMKGERTGLVLPVVYSGAVVG